MPTTPRIKALLPALAASGLLACESDPKSPIAPADTEAPDTADVSQADVPPPEPPAWLHTESVRVGLPKEADFPLFADRTADVLEPLGVIRGDGRAMVVDFDGDGRDDIVWLPTGGDEAYHNLPVFLRNTTEGGVWSFEDATAKSGMGDAATVLLVFGDIDNDGDMDAFAGTSFRSAPAAPALWLNDGTGAFTRAEVKGLLPHKLENGQYKEMAAGTLADFDGDGFLDLYLTMFNNGDELGNYYMPSPDELYRGDGKGGFTPVTLPSQHNPLTSEVDVRLRDVPRRGYGLCPADYDDDGDLDLFVNNYGAGRPALESAPLYWDWNILWRNEGEMSFIDLGESAGVAATVRGIGGVQEESPLVYKGTEFPGPIGGNGFGCHWGDFDNDGDLDLVVGTIAHPDYAQSDRTLLHVNPGGAPGALRTFGEESAERGLEYYEDELHPYFVDIDNDGRLDMAVSRLRGGSKQEFYLQDSLQRFVKRTWEETGVDIERPGATLWLDVDGDGDLDFFMPKGGTGRFFENRAATNASLSLTLVATAPTDATGARVTLRTYVGSQIREVIGGNGHYNTQPSRTLHFGLGQDSAAKDVTIRWPNGEVQVLGHVRTGYSLRVVQGGEITIVRAPTPSE